MGHQPGWYVHAHHLISKFLNGTHTHKNRDLKTELFCGCQSRSPSTRNMWMNPAAEKSPLSSGEWDEDDFEPGASRALEHPHPTRRDWDESSSDSESDDGPSEQGSAEGAKDEELGQTSAARS